MIVQTDEDLNGIQEISDIVAITLKQMREYARIGMIQKNWIIMEQEYLKVMELNQLHL